MENSLQTKIDELYSETKEISNSIFYKEGEIKDLKKILEEKTTLLNKLKIELINTCNHDWETDFVDSMKDYKLSIPIRYCRKCELTDCTVITT